MNRAASASASASDMQKPDRKTVEKNRRIHMKQLCSRLTSLIPPHHFKLSKESVSVTQQDQLDQAACYINQLKARIDELKVKKEVLALTTNNFDNSGSTSLTMPVVELGESSSGNIEVVVISGLQNDIRLCDVISVLQEEGADVTSTNVCKNGDRVFHTLHAQVKYSRVGVDTSRVLQRLQELMCQAYLCQDI